MTKEPGSLGACDTVFPKYGALLVLQGTGKYWDSWGCAHALEPGCFVQRLPGRRHSTTVGAGELWVECYVTVSTPAYNLMVDMGCLDPWRPVLQPGVDQTLIDRFAALRDELQSAGDLGLPTVFVHLQELIQHIRVLDYREADSQSRRGLEAACKLLSGDLEGVVSVPDIAAKLGLGYESFRKKFRREMGVSPGEYRIRRRIDAARMRLIQSDRTVKEDRKSVV